MNATRTIYDQGAEEIGRPQRNPYVIGEDSIYDTDEFWDEDRERCPTRYDDNSAFDDIIDGIRRDKDGWAMKPGENE